MKNDAAKARNAKTRALKPRKLKPGEMLKESTIPGNVTIDPRLYGDARYLPLGPRKRRHVAIDFPLFAVSELTRLAWRFVRGTLRALAHLFMIDFLAHAGRTARQKYRVERAMSAHDKSRRLRLPPPGVATPKLVKQVKSSISLPLDVSKSDRIEPRIAAPKRVGRPVGARDKHPRKKRVS